MNVLSNKTQRSANAKPTGLYLMELRSRFSTIYSRRQKLTPPRDSESSPSNPASNKPGARK